MSSWNPFRRCRGPVLLGFGLLAVAVLLVVRIRPETSPERSGADATPTARVRSRPDGPAEAGKRTGREPHDGAHPAPSLADWDEVLARDSEADVITRMVEATGKAYTVGECIALERILRDRAGFQWDTGSIHRTIGLQVAERNPDEFLHRAVGAWLDNPAATQFGAGLIRESMVREIRRGHERGWRAIEQVAAGAAADPSRDDLRRVILLRALIEIGAMDPDRHLERAVGLWIPDSECSRDDLRKRIEARRAASHDDAE